MARTVPDNDHLNFNDPSVWVPLFDITLTDEAYHYTPNPSPLTVDGVTYEPFPILLEGLDEDAKGNVATVRLLVSNVEGLLPDSLKTSREVEGCEVVYRSYSVTIGEVVFEETLEVISIEEITDEYCAIELGAFNPFLAQLLVEKYLKDFCWNTYKGKGCWIGKIDGTHAAPAGWTTGDPDTCLHNRDDCKRHANTMRFNSFPGIPGGGGFV